MVKNHMHKGVERSNGNLRSHPVSRQHKDKEVKKQHNLSLTGSDKQKYLQVYKQNDRSVITKKKSKKVITKEKKQPIPIDDDEEYEKPKNRQQLIIDDDGYINIDLEKSEGIKGIRLKFSRVEGRLKRTVALQFNKE